MSTPDKSTPAIPQAPSEQQMAGGARKEHQIETSAPTEVPQEAACHICGIPNDQPGGKFCSATHGSFPATDEAIAREALAQSWLAAASERAKLAMECREQNDIEGAIPLENAANAYERCARELRQLSRSTPSPSQDTEADGGRALLAKCFDHLNREMIRVGLNESAANGTQSLGREVAEYLDAARSPSHQGEQGL